MNFFVLFQRFSAKRASESLGTFLSAQTLEMAVFIELSSSKSLPIEAFLTDFTLPHKGYYQIRKQSHLIQLKTTEVLNSSLVHPLLFFLTLTLRRMEKNQT